METVFPVYSIAKTFLAQAVLELDLPLTDTIGRHLSGLSDTFSNRRIDQLLNHSSGLSDYAALADYHLAVSNGEPAWERALLISKAQALPNNHDGFQYSNVGYLLLRMLLENKTGLSMFGGIQELVLEPLSITGFSEWEYKSDIVPGYDPNWVYSGTFLADEKSLLDGYAKVIQHRRDTISLETGIVPVPFPDTGFDNPGYGFGTMNDLSADGEVSFVGHGGGGPGFSHMILLNTKTGKVALESSTTDFNQRDAILRLREKTSS